MLDRQPMSELLPYLAYNSDMGIYTLDTGVGFIFECMPNIATEETVRILRGLFDANLPEGTSVQFMLYASPNIHNLVNSYVHLRETRGSDVYIETAKKRKDFLLKCVKEPIFKGYPIRIRNYRLIISMVFPCSRTPDGYQATMRDAVKIKEMVYQTLNTIHLYPQNMQPRDLINLLNEIFNPSHPFTELNDYDERMPIKDQVVFADTKIDYEKDRLIIDQKSCKSYTVRQYPQEWDVSKGMNFIGDLFENVKQIGGQFFITLNCQYPDFTKIRGSINQRAMSANYQAFGPLAKIFPKVQLRKNNFDNFIVALENGEQPFYAYLNIILMGDDIKHLTNLAGSCNSIFRAMNFILQEDAYIMLPIFLQSLPMGYIADAQRDLRRRKTFTTNNVAELVPIQSDWVGMSNPVLPLISRRGQLFFIDTFSNPTGGYSGIVAASTGAGKSFFVNELAVSYLGVGAKVWIIDVGRSYEKLCKVVGGDFIVFGGEKPACINPFARIKDLNEEMPILKAIVAQMASREQLDELMLSYIEEAIKENYEAKGNKMTVTDIAEYLKNGGDEKQVELSKRLYPYTAVGSYEAYFEGEYSLNPQANFIVMELEELKSKKDLQEVVLLTLIYQIQQEMMGREQMKLVIIDEAWDLLRGGNTTAFMETAYRRFRKYKGACISITQSINDFYNLPAGTAIMENADFFFLLRQRVESIEALKKSNRLILSEGLYDILMSVHTDSGNYSEIFCYTPIGSAVGRLVVDRFTQLLYTTKAEEVVKIQGYVKAGMSIPEAINKIIDEEGNRAVLEKSA